MNDLDEYKLHYDEHGNIIYCSSCNSEVPTNNMYEYGSKYDKLLKTVSPFITDEDFKNRGKTRYLCRVCAETLIGRVTEYPTTDFSTKLLYITLAQITNFILREMNKS